MPISKHYGIVVDAFFPLTTSAANQIYDLSHEFVKQGFKVTIITPDDDLPEIYQDEVIDGINVVRLKTFKIKDVGYFRRAIAEFLMPIIMTINLVRSGIRHDYFDGIIWYSPTIFFGFFIHYLKLKNRCMSYLIVRDIFPQWAFDLELIKKGPAYLFFDLMAKYQYSIANTIGVQTSGNKIYFRKWSKKTGRILEVLPNWLGESGSTKCSLILDSTALKGKKVFVYAGNMGIAQDIDTILEVAKVLDNDDSIGFLLIGRGSDYKRLREKAKQLNLANVLFHSEIHPSQIHDLYSQCSVGIVSLDRRHKSHNIPGKFISYLKAGLPVFAVVNEGNDLVHMINNENVGVVSSSYNVHELSNLVVELCADLHNKQEIKNRSRSLFDREYSVVWAADKINSRIADS